MIYSLNLERISVVQALQVMCRQRARVSRQRTCDALLRDALRPRGLGYLLVPARSPTPVAWLAASVEPRKAYTLRNWLCGFVKELFIRGP